jgi:hypothetical protein
VDFVRGALKHYEITTLGGTSAGGNHFSDPPTVKGRKVRGGGV